MGQTPFLFACLYVHLLVVRMLKDPHVDATLDDGNGCTPLWYASRWGYCKVIEWLIASGRDLGDIENKKGNWGIENYSALEIARWQEMSEVESLLELFMANPEKIRSMVRVKLGMWMMAAELFAIVVFLCDDLLQLKPASHPAAPKPTAVRFFTIASKLPMELQMILCRRVVGSMKQNILRKDSEAAFKSLARELLLPSQIE